MKNKIIFLSVLFLLSAFAGAEDFFDFKNAPFLLNAAKRGQTLTFVPDAPGSDRGIWRLTYTRKENKVNLAEMILKKEMPLPAFQKNLRIEMDLETGPRTRMVGIDMRLRDAKGEVGVVNGLKKWQSGKFTAVWTITPGQKIRYSWGRNVDKVLDMPAKITNISFAMHKDNTGNLLIKNIRFIADAE